MIYGLNIIPMIFKSYERLSLGNYKTIMLGTIFHKLYDSLFLKNQSMDRIERG